MYEPEAIATSTERELPKAVTTDSISSFLESRHPVDDMLKTAVFGSRFHTKSGWETFMQDHLGSSVADKLEGPTDNWNAQTFQALYMLNWLRQPVEKGTYMIDLSRLGQQQVDRIKEARKRLPSRPSSHLSGSGSSARQDYDFLNGNDELLVQNETLDGKDYLVLKSEGNPFYHLEHLKSFLHKALTGEGLVQSAVLHAYSRASPALEQRAAENFSKPYKELLTMLDLGTDKNLTVRQTIENLFEKTGFREEPGVDYRSDATNEDLGKLLADYCRRAEGSPKLCLVKGDNGGKGGTVTDEIIEDLKVVARCLERDGPTRQSRIYQEGIAKAEDLDISWREFHDHTPTPPIRDDTFPQLPAIPVLPAAKQWKADTALPDPHPRSPALSKVDNKLECYEESFKQYLTSLLEYENKVSIEAYGRDKTIKLYETIDAYESAQKYFDKLRKDFVGAQLSIVEAEKDFEDINHRFRDWSETWKHGTTKRDNPSDEKPYGPVTDLRERLAFGERVLEGASQQMVEVQARINAIRKQLPPKRPDTLDQSVRPPRSPSPTRRADHPLEERPKEHASSSKDPTVAPRRGSHR